MTTPESPDNAVLALDPPQLLLATRPVVGAHVGLSLASYDLIPDGEGATVEVDPPLVGTVEPGDVIWLWLSGDATFLSSAFITDVNAKTRLRIPKGRLHPDRINELFYTITRNSSNIGTSEPNLTLLYNKIRPGLKDRFPEIDGHSELALLLPDAIKNGVGPDFVSAQVCVSYPYCRAYDTITLKCNGEIMTYKVGADEAPQPPNPGSAEPITVCFTVIRDYLERAARSDGTLDFSCTVTDQLGNTPDTDAVWSATQRVDEDLAGLLLPAALLREQLNDPGDDLNFIDLKKLGKNPLKLIILTADSRFQVGYTVNAVYTATLTGQTDVVVRVSGTVEADEFGQKKTLVLEVPNDKVLAGYTVAVKYELFDGATLVGGSKTAMALVVGENTIEIDAPTLVPPAINPIDALNYPQGVSVRVDFAAAQPGDKAQLVLENPLPGSPVFPVSPLAPTFAIFTLDAAFLGLWHGKVAQLRWDLIRGGEVIAESLPLVLTVNRIAHEDPRLSMPVILNYAEQNLEVTKLLETDKLSIARWLLQTKDMPVWLSFEGTLANGQPDSHIIWKGDVHRFDPSDVVIPLTAALISWLKSLKDESDVTIAFAVNFGKVVDAATVVSFPQRVYTVWITPEIIVDTSPVTISGENISIAGTTLPWVFTGNDPEGTFEQRAATGGAPPITFTSSNERIASVDPRWGVIRSEGNGTAIITVSDNAGKKKYIHVTCANVINYIYMEAKANWDAYQTWRTQQSASHPVTDDGRVVHLTVLQTKYTNLGAFDSWGGDKSLNNSAHLLTYYSHTGWQGSGSTGTEPASRRSGVAWRIIS